MFRGNSLIHRGVRLLNEIASPFKSMLSYINHVEPRTWESNCYVVLCGGVDVCKG